MNNDFTYDYSEVDQDTLQRFGTAMEGIKEEDAGDEALAILDTCSPDMREILLCHYSEAVAAYRTRTTGHQQLSWMHKHGLLKSPNRLLAVNMFQHGYIFDWYVAHGFAPGQADMLEAIRHGSRMVMKRMLDIGVSLHNVPAAAFGRSGNVAMYEDLVSFGYASKLLQPQALVVAAMHRHEGAVQWFLESGVQWPEEYASEAPTFVAMN
jgi:hypothetical protein